MEGADLIIYSDAIYTGSEQEIISGGIAISGKTILCVGSAEEVKAYENTDTVIKAYKDSLVMPGFIDAHGHFMMGATMTCDYFCNTLSMAHSELECVEMMYAFSKLYPNLDRYFGYGWLPSYWNDAPFPTKESLDRYFPEKPVYLKSVDGHSEWMNSAALKESGYLSGWEPDFGSVDKLPNGELSGLVREGGDLLCRQYDTRLPEEEKEYLQRRLMTRLNQKGITTFTEMGAELPENIDSVYTIVKKLEKEGDMTIRLALYPGTDIDPSRVGEIAPFLEKYNSDELFIGGLKGFADGVTSTYTAAMIEDYSDNKGEKGYLNHPATQYHEWVLESNKQGYGTRVHCIGDLAVRTLLDAYEESSRAGYTKNIRNTIEHIEVIHPNDIGRFAKLGVVASMQPLHLPLDEFDKINRCGNERSRYEWAHKSILKSGGVLALGTDYPIADYDPIPNLYNAVSRTGVNGTEYGPFSKEEKLDLWEALKAYTYGAAYAIGMEDKIGTLEAGKYADIAVLDRNLFQRPAEEILDTQVVLTVMNGNIVFDKEASDHEQLTVI